MATTKKDFERAASIVRRIHDNEKGETSFPRAPNVEDAFVEFFRVDSSRFDESRFRNACKG